MMISTALHNKLIALGWTPPKQQKRSVLSNKYGLTDRQEQIVLCLMGRRWASTSLLEDAVWHHGYARPYYSYDIIYQEIAKIKAKLKPFGWSIVSKYAIGYHLQKEST